MAITKIHARSVYDSRGNPTVEVDVITETGKYLFQNRRNTTDAIKASTVPLFPLEHPPVSMKLLNSAMGIKQNGLEKV
jgi:hypothetical protein